MAVVLIPACRNCSATRVQTGTPDDLLVADHCGKCPPWRCDDCGQMDSHAKPCPCWVSVEGIPLADLKALFAASDLSLGPPRPFDGPPR
jgi:hypothetical protein